MKATVKNITESDKIATYRKEKGFYREIAMIDSRDGSKIVSARFYFPGRDGMSNLYCCVWIHGDDQHGRGGGKAGGCGYHKESAALQSALGAAGVTLSEPIDGVGDRAMDNALEAVARAVITGKRKVFRVNAHA